MVQKRDGTAREAGAISLSQASTNFGHSSARLRRIKKLQFGIINPEELRQYSVTQAITVNGRKIPAGVTRYEVRGDEKGKRGVAVFMWLSLCWTAVLLGCLLVFMICLASNAVEVKGGGRSCASRTFRQLSVSTMPSSRGVVKHVLLSVYEGRLHYLP